MPPAAAVSAHTHASLNCKMHLTVCSLHTHLQPHAPTAEAAQRRLADAHRGRGAVIAAGQDVLQWARKRLQGAPEPQTCYILGCVYALSCCINQQ